MTTITLRLLDDLLAALSDAGTRPPVVVYPMTATPRGTDSATLTWEPVLSPAEQTVVDLIRQTVLASAPLPSALYAEVRVQMQTLRAFRQTSRNDFIALAQNERDRRLYDAIVAATVVFLAILREEP